MRVPVHRQRDCRMSGKIFCQIRVNATAGQIADERVAERMEVCPDVIRLEQKKAGFLTVSPFGFSVRFGHSPETAETGPETTCETYDSSLNLVVKPTNPETQFTNRDVYIPAAKPGHLR